MNNGVMVQYFEWYLSDDGTLWRRVRERAPILAAKGVTAVWLPPAYKGAAGIHDVGYGVYDLYDLGEFDQKGTVPTKYGTKAEYLEAIRALQAAGIQTYGDIVLNQMMGADKAEDVKAVETAADDRECEISGSEDIEAWTRFTFPGRQGKYSDFVWDHTCFSGVDWDQRREKKAIYNLNGRGWDPGVDQENANYDYLMGADVCFSNPRVRRHLLDWGRWYLAASGVDGFRLDAVKHISSDFFPEWLGELRRSSGKELFAVGEYWSADLGTLANYLQETGRCLSLFDVPLHFRFFQASHSNGDFDMRTLFDGTLVKEDPEKAVTFVDNHDTEAGQALASAVMEWFVPLAYAAILLRPSGYPCVFYGDYYGVPSHGGKSFRKLLDQLMEARRQKAYGPQHDYLDDPDRIGWTLEGDLEHPGSGIAVVMSDRDGGAKTMFVGARHAGESWAEITGQISEPAVIGPDGQGSFRTLGGSVAVYCHLA